MTLVIAHRGNSAVCPENTLVAFDGAIEAGVTFLECDVQMSRDGELIVIHDPTLDRTSDTKGDVRNMTLAELRRADVSYPGKFGHAFSPQRIATLPQLLRHIKGRARLMLEIKHESSQAQSDAYERRIADVVRESGFKLALDDTSELAIISFSTTVLKRLEVLIPEVPRGHLFYRVAPPAMFQAARGVGAQFIMPEKDDVSTALVDQAAEQTLGVATWVCDDEAEFARLRTLGLLGIGTNRPAVMVAIG